MLMDSHFEFGGNSTNPRVESGFSHDGSSLENRVDSASVPSISPSDKSTAVQAVESVAGGSMDSVSADENVSDVNNRRGEDSNGSGDIESREEVFSDRNHGSVKNAKSEQQKGKRIKESKSKESESPVYDSMLSMFDNFAANESGAAVVTSSMDVSPGHGFEVGDMVWGKVKSHPWWPGHVYSEEFATPAVRRSKRDGLLLVAFFGDSSYGWFDPSELMPFDSNFEEKSHQTNSKTFVKAVEEAIDEVSRRSALGLSCMCKSKRNFRETGVQGYFAVDVTDYEPGAVYSIDAIEKARDSFRPNSALDFVRQLALETARSEHAGIDFIKNKANVISYRRAVYEEFDETYAQAFGYQPTRPSPGSVQELPSGRTPSKAPLSGRQVFADTSGKGKTSTKPNKPKDHGKKDKYLFKRRDESKEVKLKQKEKPNDEYVLQKRVQATNEQAGTAIATNELPSKDEPRTGAGSEDPTIVLEFGRFDDDEKKNLPQTEDKKVFTQDGVPNSGPQKVIASQNGPRKVKVAKRPAGEMGAGKSVLPEKKKKRKKESLMSDGTHKVVPLPEKVSVKKPGQPALTLKPSNEDSHGSESETDIRRVLVDLHSLALDPFNVINRGRTVKTRKVFIKFRSVVFQKSLNSALPEDTGIDTHSVKSPAVSSATTGPENGLKPQPGSAALPDDATKGGHKRGPSDRQEEMAVKKKKKVAEIKNLTDKKKVIKKIDEPPARDVKPPVVMTGKKSEPTMLILKFPAGGSLPSINELKARFARYGPMDHSATGVFWKTFTCRVVYRSKAHAQAAYRFVTGTGSLFGNTDVKCFIKGVGSDSDLPVKPAKEYLPATEDRPSAMPGVQLKSILKKSGGDEAGGNGGRAVPRVKFLLGGGDEGQKTNLPENKNGSGSSFGDGGAPSFSSSTHATTMDFNSKNFQKTVFQSSQFARPPPLPPLQPPRSLNYGGEINPPPPLPPGNFIHNLQRPITGPPAPPKVDISQQMLSLLTKCNEVVTNVANLLGYTPYHPL